METQTQAPLPAPATPRSTPPILVIAAIAVVIFSATGTAAIMGWLPTSSGSTKDTAMVETQTDSASTTATDSAAASNPVKTATSSTAAPKSEPMQVVAAPVKTICNDCGIIESVREIKLRGDGSGLGAVGGAVVGGLVGHQFGGGDGKKITTAAGVIGGALAGHQIEKEVKATKSYEITVRLDDGSSKVINSANTPGWQTGDKVKVVDGEIRAI